MAERAEDGMFLHIECRNAGVDLLLSIPTSPVGGLLITVPAAERMALALKVAPLESRVADKSIQRSVAGVLMGTQTAKDITILWGWLFPGVPEPLTERAADRAAADELCDGRP